MSVYKSFKKDQIHYRSTVVNKTFDETSDVTDGVYTIHLVSGSSNTDSSSYWNTINTLYYYDSGRGGANLPKGNAYSYNQYLKNPQYRHKWYDEAILISISSSKFGDSIKPGSFTYRDNSNKYRSDSAIITIKDDKYGNLYGSDATVSQSAATSISSSDNYVGNIFYEHGIAVLTETGSFYNKWWDLDEAVFETTSPAMTSQDNVPYDFFFKPDGTSYWLCGATNQKAFQYDMSTPWDVSTATYANVESPTLDSFLRSIHFKDDGSKMFTLSRNTDLIKTYNLSTAWDVSTATDASETFDVWGKDDSTPDGMTFKTDGTKVYIVGNYTNKVFEYNMSTPWNVSTINDISQSYNISGSIPVEETTFGDIDFKPDGTRMYVPGRDEDNVYEWKLGTAWDVSTATFNVSKSISSEEANITSVRWKPDGSKMYIVGWSNDDITQYDMPSASFYTSSGQSYTIDYSSAVILKTLSFKCHIREDEFNATLNPTVFDGTNHKIKSSALVSPNKNQVRTEKFTYVNFDRNIVNQKFRHEDFRTYFTKIGFYNNAGELLMIASLPRPIQVHNDRPMTVTARIDF